MVKVYLYTFLIWTSYLNADRIIVWVLMGPHSQRRSNKETPEPVCRCLGCRGDTWWCLADKATAEDAADRGFVQLVHRSYPDRGVKQLRWQRWNNGRNIRGCGWWNVNKCLLQRACSILKEKWKRSKWENCQHVNTTVVPLSKACKPQTPQYSITGAKIRGLWLRRETSRWRRWRLQLSIQTFYFSLIVWSLKSFL